MAVTKSGTGTWDLRCEDSGTLGRVTRGCGTRGCRDVGHGDARTWDAGTRDMGTRGLGMRHSKTLGLGDVGHKQTTPTIFCALEKGVILWRQRGRVVTSVGFEIRRSRVQISF